MPPDELTAFDDEDEPPPRLTRGRAARLLVASAAGLALLGLFDQTIGIAILGSTAPLHALLELVAVIGAAAVVVVTVGAGRADSPASLQLASAAFLAVAVLGAAHLLAWPGFPDVVTPNTPHKSAILRITARLFATAGLFSLALPRLAPTVDVRLRSHAHAIVVGIAALLLYVALVHPTVVPALAGRDGAPTALAIGLEALCLAMHAAMLVQLVAGRAPDRPIHGGLLVLAVGFSAISQLYLVGPHGALRVGELLGHLTRIASFTALVAGVVFAMVREPYRRLQVSERALRQSQRLEAVARLAGGVAHDFNNLLTTILASSEFAQFDASLTPEQRLHLQEISGAARRAARLTRELLAFGQPTAPLRRRIDAGTFVHDLQPTLVRLVAETVTLDVHVPSEPVPLDADRILLEQALVHLITNAGEAMPHGGVITIDVGTLERDRPLPCVGRSLPAGRYATVTVRDTGGGIPPSLLPKIFDPFFTTHGPGSGSGLGLPMVLGIATAHGGGVQLESMEGEGTIVRLLLPMGLPTPLVAA